MSDVTIEVKTRQTVLIERPGGGSGSGPANALTEDGVSTVTGEITYLGSTMVIANAELGSHSFISASTGSNTLTLPDMSGWALMSDAVDLPDASGLIPFSTLSGSSSVDFRQAIIGDISGLQAQLDSRPSIVEGEFGPTSGASLGSLSDVTITSAVLGHAVMYDGSEWVNRVLVEADISDFGSYADASHTHTLSDISDSGTSAAFDVAAAGNAAVGEVVKGDDTRLTDNRDPNAHSHTLSDISDSGTSAAFDVAAAGDAAAGEVVRGDDTRLADNRDPNSHNHSATEITSGTLDNARLSSVVGRTDVAKQWSAAQQFDSIHITGGAGRHSFSSVASIGQLVGIPDVSGDFVICLDNSYNDGDILIRNGDAFNSRPLVESDISDLGSYVQTLSDSKSATIESPTSSEDISLFFTKDAITVSQLTAVVRGSSTPSVTLTVRHSTDRSLAGTEVVTGGTVVTNTTTGTVVTSFDDATIPANSFIWIETTAQSGTVDELNLTIDYDKD